MKIAIVSLLVLGTSVAGAVGLTNDGETVAAPVQEQQNTQQDADPDELYNLAMQARAQAVKGARGVGSTAAEKEARRVASTASVSVVSAAKGARKAAPTSRR